MSLMEQGWQRHHAFLDLDRAALEARLRVPFPGARLAEVTPLSGGLRNSNYRVRLADRDGPLVVRLFTADPGACRREVALAARVGATVPVPPVLYADPEADPPFAVTPWVEGTRLDDVLATADEAAIEGAARAAGATLARVHAYALPEPGFLGPDLSVREPLDLIDGWLGHVEYFLFRSQSQAGARLDEDLRHRFWRLAPRMAPRLTPLRGVTTLVQADYKPWNLIVRPAAPAGGWAMAAVLDWEFSFAGPPLVDLAVFLRHRATFPPAYTRGFLAGYTAGGGHLPEDWAVQTQLLDLLNLCSMLSQPGGGVARTRDIGALVRATVDGWDAA